MTVADDRTAQAPQRGIGPEIERWTRLRLSLAIGIQNCREHDNPERERAYQNVLEWMNEIERESWPTNPRG